MARIPLDVATQALDAGPSVNYPVGGGPVDASVERLGASIAGLAGHVDETRKRHETFDAALREQEFLEELKRVEGEAVVRSPPDGEGLHDTIYVARPGEAKGRSLFDEVFGRHAAGVPESRRPAFEASREHYRQAGSTRLAAVQLERRREYESGAFARIRERLLAGVRDGEPAGADGFEAARRKGLEIILAMTGGEQARAALATAWERDITLAGIEARLRQDPGFAARARSLLD